MAIGNTNPTDKVGVTPDANSAKETNANNANVTAGTGASVTAPNAVTPNVNAPNMANIISPLEVTHVNDVMFTQMADLITKPRNVLGEKDQALIDKTIAGRVVDLSSYIPVMGTAKMNLMPSGNLILSMYNGEHMFNHLMTPKERSFMSEVLNNPNLEDSQKLGKLTSLVSGIAMTTQMGYNFDKNMSQGESVSMHR